MIISGSRSGKQRACPPGFEAGLGKRLFVKRLDKGADSARLDEGEVLLSARQRCSSYVSLVPAIAEGSSLSFSQLNLLEIIEVKNLSGNELHGPSHTTFTLSTERDCGLRPSRRHRACSNYTPGDI